MKSYSESKSLVIWKKNVRWEKLRVEIWKNENVATFNNESIEATAWKKFFFAPVGSDDGNNFSLSKNSDY